MKHKLLLGIFGLFGFMATAQITIVTSPPLVANNGSSAVTFEVQTLAPVNVTQIANVFNAGTITCEVWYRVGGVLAASETAPNVNVANGWILAGTASGFTAINNTDPTVIPLAGLNISVLPGQPVGFCLNASTGGTRYVTYTAANQEDFTNIATTVKTGPGFGFGGTITSWIAQRQFAGTVTYLPGSPCVAPPFVGNATSTRSIACPAESFVLSVDTATFGSGQTYQWQSSPDSINWTNLANDTLPNLIRNQTVTTYYRIVFTCSGQSTNSGAVKVETPVGNLAGGTYTINSATATGGTNFNSFFDFLEAIKCNGIGGPIVVNVAPGSGPYNEQVIFGIVPNTSATNTITINGNDNLLTFSGAVGNRGVLGFLGTQHVTVNNLQIQNLDAANAYGVEFRDNAQFITLDGLKISMNTSATPTTISGIVMSNNPTSPTVAGLAASNVTIKNCEVIGGYYGLVLNGPTIAPWSENNIIENNIFSDFYLYGIFIRGQKNSQIIGNDISRANRTVLSTFYGIYTISGMEGVLIDRNSIHNNSDGSLASTSAAYPIYVTGTNATATDPLIFSNNLIYNINSNGTIYGIYMLSGNFIEYYHNTVLINNPNTNTSAIRAMFVSATSGTFTYNNNIFAVEHNGTGAKYCVWMGSAVPTHNLNYNQYHMASNGTNNHIGYLTSNSTTFANWQAAGPYEANGVEGNPVFAGPLVLNMTPLGGPGNNTGLNLLTKVPNDFFGAARTATPDMGAIEFTPITSDVTILSATLNKGQCLSTADTITVVIQNVLGGILDFSTDPLNIVWNVSGPANSNGTIAINTGTLQPGAIGTFQQFSVNLSVPGNYQVNAFIQPSTFNQFAGNDTLLPTTFDVNPIFQATPASPVVITNNTDSVELNLRSPFISAGTVFITEICHFKTANGAPVGGWPAYLIADDYIEITGIPGTDLAGYTLEQWNASAIISNNTFPVGTLFGPNGTMVVAVGQLSSSVPSPANFYYHDGNTSTFGSTTTAGRIIKDPAGNIVDAVVYGAFTFPPAAGVTTADWSGITPSVSSSGNRLEGPYTKDATNWINSGTSPQDPNTVNNNVSVPTPTGVVGFSWSLGGVTVDTMPNTWVGPWNVSGTYQYVASYFTPCGLLTDTVTIIVNLPVNCDPATNVAAANTSCTSTDISWNSGTGVLTSIIEYGAPGFTPGTGTRVTGATSPQTITGLMAGTAYEFHVIDSCADGQAPGTAVLATTNPLPVASGTHTIISVGATGANVDFDGAASTDYTSIEWFFGDGNSAIGVAVSHVYTTNQTYTVLVVATGACGVDTATFQVTIQGVGLIDNEIVQSLNVYPNPTNGVIQVTFMSSGVQNIAIRVVNISGQIMYQSSRQAHAGQYNGTLDLSAYPSGPYLLQIETSDGVVTRRIFLNR
jgi:parallel beta-helix repeat protein